MIDRSQSSRCILPSGKHENRNEWMGSMWTQATSEKGACAPVKNRRFWRQPPPWRGHTWRSCSLSRTNAHQTMPTSSRWEHPKPSWRASDHHYVCAGLLSTSPETASASVVLQHREHWIYQISLCEKVAALRWNSAEPPCFWFHSFHKRYYASG